MSETRPTRARRSDPTPQSASVELSRVVAALMGSLIQAKRQMDEASAELARQYAGDEILSAFPVPAFSVASVELRLRFAIEGVEASGTEAHVIVDQSVLAAMPPHLLSEIALQVVPQPMHAYASDSDDRVLAHG
jgi:hypothetical protein